MQLLEKEPQVGTLYPSAQRQERIKVTECGGREVPMWRIGAYRDGKITEYRHCPKANLADLIEL